MPRSDLPDVLESCEAERLATGFIFTEGPLWHPDGHWFFVDIRQNKLFACLRGGPRNWSGARRAATARPLTCRAGWSCVKARGAASRACMPTEGWNDWSRPITAGASVDLTM